MKEWLDKNDAHIWKVELGDATWDRHRYALNDVERQRAERFLTAELRQRYARGHSALRVILGRYLTVPPEDIEFRTGQYGKPELSTSALNFNFSHSHDTALIAVSRMPVGVDIEHSARPILELDGMAELICHVSEKELLISLIGKPQQDVFYRIWTQKEAYCKALGVGLQHKLTSVFFEPLDASCSQVFDDEEKETATAFYAYSRELAGPYVASLCVASPNSNLSWFDASST